MPLARFYRPMAVKRRVIPELKPRLLDGEFFAVVTAATGESKRGRERWKRVEEREDSYSEGINELRIAEKFRR